MRQTSRRTHECLIFVHTKLSENAAFCNNNVMLCIKLPTRSRPEKALYVLEQYVRMLADPDRVTFVVNIDEDDITMNTDQMKQQLRSLAAPGRMDVHVANNQCKVEACNAGMEGREFDILLLPVMTCTLVSRDTMT